VGGNGAPEPSGYRTARIASAGLCFFVAGALALLSQLTRFDVNPLILVPFLVVGAALLSVKVQVGRG
jgi:hypothetical protein